MVRLSLALPLPINILVHYQNPKQQVAVLHQCGAE